MTSVDKRVVEMQFDNSKFEKNVEKTMKSLENLEKSLQLKNGGQGFQKLTDAANGFKLDGISKAVESINDKFSVMGVVAFNIISRITNAAMDMFTKVSSATLGTIISGGQTRALNLEQARFQMQGLGMDVEAVMQDVDYAVSGTAYSLDAAAKVAGQLGASGIQAGDQMKSALRGVSGLAAMTGSSYEDVGNIFTKVAGQGRLMGDDLLRLSSRGINGAATLAKYLNKSEAEVRDMVTKGKIDFQTFSDAMNETFGEHATKANETFSGAMSNVKSALGRIGAKFFTPFYENARDVLNAIRPVINGINDALDPMFSFAEKAMKKVSGSISTFMEGVDLSAMTENVKQFGLALEFVFGLSDGGEVVDLGISKDTLANANAVKGIIEGVVDVFGELKKLLPAIKGPFNAVFGGEGGNLLIDFGKKFKEVTDKFKIGKDEILSVATSFHTFFTIVKNVATVIRSLLVGAFTILKPILSIVGTIIGYVAAAFGSFVGVVMDGTPPAEVFAGVIEKVSVKIGEFFTKLSNGLPSVESFSSVLTSAKDKFREFTSGFSSGIPGALESIGNGFKTLAEWIGKAKDAAGDFISKINWNSVFLGAGGVAAGAGAGGVILSIKAIIDRIKDVATEAPALIESLKGAFGSLGGVLEAYQNNLNAKSLVSIALAIGILAASLMVLSTIDPSGITNGVWAMGMLMMELVGMVYLLKKINPASLVKTSASLVVLSTALLIMSTAMTKFAGLSWGDIAKGSVAMVVLAGIMIGLTAAMNAIKSKAIGGAASMVIIAAALLVLSSALTKLGSIDQNVLVQGFVAMTAALLVLTVALNFMKSAVGGAIAMVFISTALVILSQALRLMGELPMQVLVQGGIAIAAMLAVLVVALNLIGIKGLLGAAAIVVVSAALLVLTGVIAILGAMPMEMVAQGIIGFVAALLGMSVVLGILSLFGPMVLVAAAAILVISAGMMVAAASVVVMAVGLNLLAKAGWGSLGMLALLGRALLPLVLISPFLLIAGAGLLALGVGLVAAGAGMLLFSKSSPMAILNLVLLAVAMGPLLVAAPLMVVVAAGMLALGVASIVLGAGLAVLALSMTMLNLALPDGIESLKQFIVIVLELGVLSPVIIAVGISLLAFGVGAVVAGAGAVVFGLGCLVLAGGLAVLSMALPMASDALVGFSTAISGLVPMLGDLFILSGALIVLGLASIVSSLGFMALGLSLTLLAAGFTALVAAGSGAIDILWQLADASGHFAWNAPGLIVGAGGLAAFGIAAILVGAASVLLAQGVGSLSESIDILHGNTGTIEDSLSGLVEVLDEIKPAIPGIIESTQPLTDLSMALAMLGPSAILSASGLTALYPAIDKVNGSASSFNTGALDDMSLSLDDLTSSADSTNIDSMTGSLGGLETVNTSGVDSMTGAFDGLTSSADSTAVDSMGGSLSNLEGLDVSSLDGMSGSLEGMEGLDPSALGDISGSLEGMEGLDPSALGDISGALGGMGDLDPSALTSMNGSLEETTNLDPSSVETIGTSLSELETLDSSSVNNMNEALQQTQSLDATPIDNMTAALLGLSEVSTVKMVIIAAHLSTIQPSASTATASLVSFNLQFKTLLSLASTSAGPMNAASIGIEKVSVSLVKLTNTTSESVRTINSSMEILVRTTTSSLRQVEQQFTKLGPSVANGIATAVPAATTGGRNVVQGFINGSNSLLINVNYLGRRIGQTMVDGINAGAGNRSPSKKTFKSGVNADQGLINGMLNLLVSVGRTGELVGKTAVESVAEGFNNMESVVGSHDLTPSISPVVNLDEVNRGAGVINSFGTGLRTDVQMVRQIAATLDQEKDQYDDSRIISQLEQVNTRLMDLEMVTESVQELSSKMDGLTVSMDGTTVGKIVTPYVNRNIRVDQERRDR